LDPLNDFMRIELARISYFERDFERAAADCDEVLAESPDFVWALLFRGLAYEQLGRYREAAESIARSRRVIGQDEMASALEQAFAADGYPGFLQEWIRWWTTSPDRAQPTSIAMILARAGEVDEAFRWLERGFEERTRYMVNLDVEPQFDALRSDPRFEGLLRRMHFPGH